MSCDARAIVGVDDNVPQKLPSDDDNFFGTPPISSHRSSRQDESSLQPATKVPRVADRWSDSNSSSSESSSYCTEVIDFSGDGGDSEEEPANEKMTVNMDQDESNGCTCRCKDHDHFIVRAAHTLVKVERQMRETRGRDKDNLLLERGGCHAPRQAAGGARTRTPFEYSIKDQPVCKSVFCRVYRVSATRLKRIQKLLRSGVCAHAS